MQKRIWALWTAFLAFPIFVQSQQTPTVARPPIVSGPTINEYGPHHRKWVYSALETIDGLQVIQPHSYTELKSGMNV